MKVRIVELDGDVVHPGLDTVCPPFRYERQRTDRARKRDRKGRLTSDCGLKDQAARSEEALESSRPGVTISAVISSVHPPQRSYSHVQDVFVMQGIIMRHPIDKVKHPPELGACPVLDVAFW